MVQADPIATGQRSRSGAPWGMVIPAARRFVTSDRPFVWLMPLVLVLIFIGIFPLVYNLYTSFREYDYQAFPRRWDWVGFDNWVAMFQSQRVRDAVGTTAVYVGAALAIEFALGLAIAVLLNSGPRFAGLWQSMLILPIVIPPTVVAVMFSVLINAEYGVISWLTYELGLLDKSEPLLGGTGRYAMIAVLIPDIWQWTPFFVLILLAGLKALPEEPMEAAQVDGAGAWQRFRDITLPMLRPMIAVAVLFRMVDLLKVFDYIYVMTSGGPGRATEVVSYYTYDRIFNRIDWGYGATLGLAILIVAIVLANVYIKVFKVEW